jgi:predicted Zn finger-like uncharacterized protein
MDVRCEKCSTEYELDDARVKPGGVAVKCTSCGHVFRVRRHSITSVGVGLRDPMLRRPDTERDEGPRIDDELDDAPPARNDTIPIRALDADAPPGPRAARMTPSSARARARGSKERNWLVRLPSGEIETCRELATLHQWIIAGKVTRNSGISRTGKSWKRLGEITELVPFFDVAEETRRARMGIAPGAAETEAMIEPPMDAESEAEAVPLVRPTGRVIQPIPDSFSASGPVLAEPDEPDGPGDYAGEHEQVTRLDGATPAGLAALGSLLPEPDEDEVPTTQVKAIPRAGQVAAPAAGARAGAGARLETESEDIEISYGDSRAATESEQARNPLDHRLPAAGPPAGAALGRAPAPGVAMTIRGPAPVPTAPAASARPAEGAAAARPTSMPDAAGARAAGGAAGLPLAAPAAGADEPGAARRVFPTAASAEDAFDGPRSLSRTALARAAAQEGPQGPSAGLTRRTSMQDVAFAGGKIRPLSEDAGPAHEPAEERPATSSSRAGRWIVLVALLLMAGSAAAVYMLVFRPTGVERLALDLDAGTEEVVAGLDAGAAPVEVVDASELAELVRARLAADTRAGLEALDQQLRELATGETGATLAARARVHTALAQQVFDRVALAREPAEAATLEREAKALVLDALTLAQRALQANREDPDALVAMADVQRLQGRPARQVESYLATALKAAPEHREARLVRALTLAASERERKEARKQLEALIEPGRGNVRPVYRLALLDLAEGKAEDARRRASEVLAVAAAHEGARALLAQLDATTVDVSDPMPVEEAPANVPEDDKDERSGRGGRERSDKSSSYGELVAEAASKVKAGDCGAALKLYERALDEDPSGVAALLGMAECHVERKEFSSAHGKLQAVLGVSPSHAEAMWLMAESYRKQGLNDQAVTWYQKYVEEHPSGARAKKARQRLGELGAGGGGGGGASGGGGEAPGGGSTPPAGEGSTPAPAPEGGGGSGGSGGSGGEPGATEP